MKISKFARRAITACVAAFTLAGCGGGGSPLAFSPFEQRATQLHLNAQSPVAVRPDFERSWIARGAKAQNLLYVSIEGFNDVYVYSYLPAPPKLVGKLTGFKDPLGECADKKGDVYIVNAKASNIREYAHGGTKPIAIISDKGSDPVGCSLDPTTGNLAVSNSSARGRRRRCFDL